MLFHYSVIISPSSYITALSPFHHLQLKRSTASPPRKLITPPSHHLTFPPSHHLIISPSLHLIISSSHHPSISPSDFEATKIKCLRDRGSERLAHLMQPHSYSALLRRTSHHVALLQVYGRPGVLFMLYLLCLFCMFCCLCMFYWLCMFCWFFMFCWLCFCCVCCMCFLLNTFIGLFVNSMKIFKHSKPTVLLLLFILTILNHFQPLPTTTDHLQPPPTTTNHFQPPPTTSNHHQLLPTTSNRHQPLPTTTNHFQPPPTTR